MVSRRRARSVRRVLRLLTRTRAGRRPLARRTKRVSFLLSSWRRAYSYTLAPWGLSGAVRRLATSIPFVYSIPQFSLLANASYSLSTSLSYIKSRYRFFLPRNINRFRRGPFFQARFLSVWRLHSDYFLGHAHSFFYTDPYNFVDYKRVKKTLFRRLLTQKYRMDRRLRPQTERVLEFRKWYDTSHIPTNVPHSLEPGEYATLLNPSENWDS